MIQTKEVSYRLSNTLTGKAFFAYDDNAHENKPLVLIAPDWRGRGQFYCQKAIELAEQGYVSFVLDLYGDAKVCTSLEDKPVYLAPLKENRQELLNRILSGFDCMKAQGIGDSQNIVALGYCFGGMCVLDLARSGAAVKGVVSIHGLLSAPNLFTPNPIVSKIMVLHAYEDTFVSPEQILAFSDEMTQREADWQLHIFGRTQHAFAVPGMDDSSQGLKYNALADSRSQQIIQNFLSEALQSS